MNVIKYTHVFLLLYYYRFCIELNVIKFTIHNIYSLEAYLQIY